MTDHNSRNDILKAQLEEYADKGLYPFHMPGHKRRVSPAGNMPVDYDLTEVEGVDDLHHAEGILKDAMERTAQLFGARRTWYLVGGSTVGNLAGIRALAPYGSEVVVARNCHKSVYHAIELGNLKVHWIWPEYDEAFGIYGSIRPGTVARALRDYPASRAVVLTSPTYEGVISDIASIAAICHAHFCTDPAVRRTGIPLMVDEAHGAHLGLFTEGGFPASALRCGADLVVQSAHKTLPSLTQTAFLHLGWGKPATVPSGAVERGRDGGKSADDRPEDSPDNSLVSAEEIEQQINIFETSSPSYPLMCSLDGCTGLLRNSGDILFREWGDSLDNFSRFVRMHHYQNLRVLCYGYDRLEDHPAFYDFDKSKILISCRGCAWKKGSRRERENAQSGGKRPGVTSHSVSAILQDPSEIPGNDSGIPGKEISGKEISGKELADVLRNDYHMETEMHMGSNVLCMTSCADNMTRYLDLADALREMDTQMEKISPAVPGTDGQASGQPETIMRQCGSTMTIAEALRRRTEWLPETESTGRTAAEYIYPYPPGIPVIVPGETITQEKLTLLRTLSAQGATLIHTGGESHTGEIRVVAAAAG